MALPTQAQYSLTIRLELDRRPDVLAEVVSAMSRAGGDVGAVDLVAAEEAHTVRDFTIDARDQAHWDAILDAARAAGAKVLDASDRTFRAHLGGKIDAVAAAARQTGATGERGDTIGFAAIDAEQLHAAD